MARLAFAMAALIGAIALGGSALAANASVAMSGVQFVPSAVTVNVGERVTWTNQDEIPHSARADNGSFDTGVFPTGSRSVTFAQAGTFGYFCTVHPSMRGTVNVVAAATPPPPTPRPATPRPATPAPTAPPTAQPTAVPPTASPAPSPTPTPTATAAAATASPTPTAVALQVSATPSATAPPDGSSRSGDGVPPLLLIGGVAAVLALAGGAFALSKRG
jgi:plastocyanin